VDQEHFDKITWNQIDEACNLLAEQITNSKINFKKIFAIPRGGFIPGVILSHKLGIPLVYNYINTTSLLIVDDICDTGETLISINKLDKVSIATIHYHPVSPIEPNFWVWEKKDNWIVYPWENIETEGSYDKSFNV